MANSLFLDRLNRVWDWLEDGFTSFKILMTNTNNNIQKLENLSAKIETNLKSQTRFIIPANTPYISSAKSISEALVILATKMNSMANLYSDYERLLNGEEPQSHYPLNNTNLVSLGRLNNSVVSGNFTLHENDRLISVGTVEIDGEVIVEGDWVILSTDAVI